MAQQAAGGWLFKVEPGCYSYADLERDGTTVWDGVANALARQHLRAVKVGDRVLYYHTGLEKAVVGEARVVNGPYPEPGSDDPKTVAVTIAPARRWAHPVALHRIKQDAMFQEWELVRQPRLSILPVSPERWLKLEEMGKAAGPAKSLPPARRKR